MSRLFDRLEVWYDGIARTGAENMAVDQLLMEGVDTSPVLRVYHWSEPTVSFGYFQSLEEAMRVFPDSGVRYMRRWTGGGVVDHRIDVTYTLVIPRADPLANMRGALSYCKIHEVLSRVLNGLGADVALTPDDLGNGDVACFENPVAYDITDAAGNKVAGAGQRRSKYGLLHQGSVVAEVEASNLYDQLISSLASEHDDYALKDDFLLRASGLAVKRYASEPWLRKR